MVEYDNISGYIDMTLEYYNKRDTISGFVAVIIWSSAICLSRSLMEKIGLFTAAGTIYLLGGMISFSFYWITQRLNPDNSSTIRFYPRHLIVCGIPFVLYVLCLYLAVGLSKSRQQVIEVGLLNYLWPTFTLIFSIPLLNKRANLWLLPGTVVALSGIFLANIVVNGIRISIFDLCQNFGDNVVPYLLGLAAAILWGLYSNLANRFSNESHVYSIPSFLLITGIVLQIIRCFFSEHSAWTNIAIVELAVMIFFPTIIAYVMWDSAMRRGNLLLVASFAYFTPLFSTILSGLYLGVALGFGIWIAGVLTIAGAWISKLSMKEKITISSSNTEFDSRR